MTDFVPFRITVCGIEELDQHCAVGVSHVLSIMDPGREAPPAFGKFGEHVRLDLRFDDIIDEREGMIPPSEEDVRAVLSFGQDLAGEPNAHLLVHCHMGVSRSTASMALILAQARRDRTPAEALAQVYRIRPQTWPNLRMLEMGDRLLGLDGALVAAARDHYARVAKREPDKARYLRDMGRGREVEHIKGL